MNLHEYQAKDLLRKYNLPILDGKYYIENIEGISKDIKNINNWIDKNLYLRSLI